MTKRKVLTHSEYYTVRKYVEANKNVITAFSLDDACKKVSTIVGIVVPRSTLRELASELKLRFKYQRSASKSASSGDRNSAASIKTEYLARAVRDLYKLYGLDVPEYVAAILTRKSIDEIKEIYDKPTQLDFIKEPEPDDLDKKSRHN